MTSRAFFLLGSEPHSRKEAEVVDRHVDGAGEVGVAVAVLESCPVDVDRCQVDGASKGPALAEQILATGATDPLTAADVFDTDVEPPEPGDEAPFLREHPPVLEVEVRQRPGCLDVAAALSLVAPLKLPRQGRPNLHDPNAEPESCGPTLLDPRVVGVVEEVLGDVESKSDSGIEVGLFRLPTYSGRRLR